MRRLPARRFFIEREGWSVDQPLHNRLATDAADEIMVLANAGRRTVHEWSARPLKCRAYGYIV
jgi:hypothetical protein